MAVIHWTNRALSDLEDIGNYIEKDSVKYASITLKGIFSSAMLLKDFPDLGRIVPEFNNPIIKELIHGNYRIVYRKISSDKIEIITVHHSARQLNDIK
jgi:plasmid stabilization system protein ParE